MSKRIKGKAVTKGVAIGKVLLAGQNIDNYLNKYKPKSLEEEKNILSEAIIKVKEQIDESISKLNKQELKEQVDILTAHKLMIDDPEMSKLINSKVEENLNAPKSVIDAFEYQAKMFEAIDDEYLRARAIDLRDVGKRIAKYILGIKTPQFGEEKIIVAGVEIEPSIIAELPADKIAGVILGQGSITSHAIIIAKARAIPSIVGVNEVNKLSDGEEVIIDADTGEIIIQPEEEEQINYTQKILQQTKLKESYMAMKEKPAMTTDGKKITLAANISSPADMDFANDYGAEGVGLFRSEFLFMNRSSIPNEEEQFQSYKEAIEKCKGNLCIIRTMDIGGDKPLSYLQVDNENNPFLGYRAIRISLKREDLFIPQLKAILRAGIYGKVAIMFPMIINVDEFQLARTMVEKAKLELINEDKKFSNDVQLGIMIETPAAAVMSPILAHYVDFFSIGTNDLVQYTLAVDRGNVQISNLYSHFNPAVLRLIKLTIESAIKEGKWIGMCGEMASDPNAVEILIAMGINELSMSAPSIPIIKEKIRSISTDNAKKILDYVMNLETANEIESYLAKL